jgi:hypothetical protein
MCWSRPNQSASGDFPSETVSHTCNERTGERTGERTNRPTVSGYCGSLLRHFLWKEGNRVACVTTVSGYCGSPVSVRLQPNLGHFRPLSATFGHFRPLSATLSATLIRPSVRPAGRLGTKLQNCNHTIPSLCTSDTARRPPDTLVTLVTSDTSVISDTARKSLGRGYLLEQSHQKKKRRKIVNS